MARKHDRYGQHIYGTVHKKERKRWALRVRAGGVCCWRCGDPIPAYARWDLGNVDEDGRRRGFPLRHPEHRHSRDCSAGGNRATVTHLKQQLSERERRFGGLPDPTPGNSVERWCRHWSGGFNPRCPDCRARGEACEAAQRFEASERKGAA
jgi:hypothetical protein